MKILIIEDDEQIIEAISLALEIRWPEAAVVSARLGEKGVQLVETEKPDVVVLDLGLPDISGFDVLKQIRLFSDVPVLILTVRSEEASIVKGLEWGADDYATKPFKQLELLARIKALLRRRGAAGVEPPLTVDDLTLDPAGFRLTRSGQEIELTRTEGIIMFRLMKNAGRVVSHSEFAEALWGTDYPGISDSLKVYIRRLREKLEEDPSQPKRILNKAGAGYFLARPD
ncbi:MAG: response regulator transcription factor [Dehalococcoidia bacterium]|nr:response regulator transcription factor [Dehalococcoidia bacterium]